MTIASVVSLTNTAVVTSPIVGGVWQFEILDWLRGRGRALDEKMAVPQVWERGVVF